VTPRRLALLLFLAAIALYVGLAYPQRQAAQSASAALLRVQASHEAIRMRLARLEHPAGRQARAAALLASAAMARGTPSAVRRDVLAALAQFPVSGVRLDVAAKTTSEPVAVRLEAQGGFLDLVALSSRLAHPDLALALQRVALSPLSGTTPGARLVVEATALGGQS
jgi:hypothetical protein